MLMQFAGCRHQDDAATAVRRRTARFDRLNARYTIGSRALSGATAG